MRNLVQLKDLNNLEVIEIKQFENNDRDRPDFDNKYLKILYFFQSEGVISTLRKYFAYKYPQKYYLTFVFIKYNNKKYINISTQFQQKANDFVMDNNFYKYTQIDFNSVTNQIDYYLSQFNQFVGNENYELFNIETSYSVSLKVDQHFPEVELAKGLFIFGLGGYVKMFIMQHFKHFNKIACVDYKAPITWDFQRKYGFKYGFLLPANSYQLIKAVHHPVVIISTYHSDHASLAYEIFKINPNTSIFIEKPPAVTLEDLDKLIELYNKGAKIEIGFNRRFISFSNYVHEKVKNKTVVITCSVKEVIINSNHWYLWNNQGTRVTGNLVHWFDLANYWIPSVPVEINLISNPDDQESVVITVLYKNGSLLNITASDVGNSLRGVQEKIEIRFNNETIFIDDFVSLEHIKSNGIKIRKIKLLRDKGHKSMYRNFLQIINKKRISDYTVYDLINTSVVTFYASSMLQNNIRNLKIENEITKYYNCELKNHEKSD